MLVNGCPMEEFPMEMGFGVRRLREFNLSLLGKWCRRMIIDKEGLRDRVLHARYGEEGGRLKEGGSEDFRKIAWVD